MRASIFGPPIDTCPICSRTLALDSVELHVLQGYDVHSFRCDQCGPVKARVVSSKSSKTAPQQHQATRRAAREAR